MQYVGGRGLTIGACDAVDLHAPRRIAIDLPGQYRQSTPCVCHYRGRDTSNVALSHNEDGPATDGLGRKLRPVTLEARDRNEDEVRLYATGIVRHAPYAPHARRDLRPENPTKLCPVKDHSPSVARGIMRSSPRFSQKNAIRRNMPEILRKQRRNTPRFSESRNVVKEYTRNKGQNTVTHHIWCANLRGSFLQGFHNCVDVCPAAVSWYTEAQERR